MKTNNTYESKSKVARWRRIVCAVLGLMLLAESGTPVYALTGGPSAPEFTGFQALSSSDMVDMFSGDFSYNLNLMDVGGYPLNLSYATGVSMEDEASWVGLGWTLNPGSITRGLQGLPDDFNGDEIVRDQEIRGDFNLASNVGKSIELLGMRPGEDFPPDLRIGNEWGVVYNNYRGIGFEQTVNISFQSAGTTKGGLQGSLGLNMRNSSMDGIDIRPNLGLGARLANSSNGQATMGGTFSMGYNSRGGIRSMDAGFGVNYTRRLPGVPGDASTGKPPIPPVDKGTAPLKNNTTTFPMGTQVYSPPMQNHFFSIGVNLAASIGGEQTFLNPNFTAAISLSKQFYGRPNPDGPGWQTVFSRGSYGYYYAENGQNNPEALQDFSRDNDGPITEATTQIGVPFLTHDVFNVSGHGTGGAFITRRTDIGRVSDPRTTNSTLPISLGVEFGVFPTLGGGGGVDIGGNFGLVNNRSVSEAWVPEALNGVGYTSSGRSYFRAAGELTALPQGTELLFNRLGAFGHSRFNVSDQGVGNQIVGILGETVPTQPLTNSLLTGANIPPPRPQLMQALTAQDAATAGLDKRILSYPRQILARGSDGYYALSATSASADRVNSFRKGHHFSEMRVTQPDGRRYVYGIPVYNKVQREYSFNVENINVDENNENDEQLELNEHQEVIGYHQGVGANTSIKRKQGTNHFYEMTETPAYPTHFLLTAILSPDYVDVTGDGVTPDDYGTAVRFNYERVHDNYRWRSPFVGARFSHGLLSPEARDNKASFIYGEKEVWYLNSIETKTHIAFFHISPREDGMGVRSGLDGEILGGDDISTSQRIYRLDAISLFTRAEFARNGLAGEPLKQVHFRYAGEEGASSEQALCPNIPNYYNDQPGGKLTLSQVFFTYGRSSRGRVTGYKFKYGFNPSYRATSIDRWGNYLPEPDDLPTPASLVKPWEYDNPIGKRFSNSSYPYVPQPQSAEDRENLDEWAGAWCLTQIQTPSGGIINVEYEADDYAYVQNKRAMEHFRIAGFARNEGDALNDQMYDLGGGSPAFGARFRSYNWLAVDVPGTLTAQEFQERYLDNTQEGIYFRFLVDINGRNKAGGHEFVSGYAPYTGVSSTVQSVNGGTHSRVFIKLAEVPLAFDDDNTQVNSIVRTAWNFAAEYTPYLVYPGSYTQNLEQSAIEDIAIALKQFLAQYGSMFASRNRTFASQDFCRNVMLEHSTIRLTVADGEKVGGGSRVRRLLVTDNWESISQMPGASDFTSGQEYVYRTVEQVAGGSRVISSGVAENEPLAGYDECAVRLLSARVPVSRLRGPSSEFYDEDPASLSHMPPPRVGYSRIQVRQLANPGQTGNVGDGPNGFEEYSFYTAKDFPAREESACQVKRDRTSRISIRAIMDPFFAYKEFLYASQGYVMVTNDMHGKQMAQRSYAFGQPSLFETAIGDVLPEYAPASLSSTEYIYRQDDQGRLNNTVPMVNPDGTVSERLAGIDWHYVIDSRSSMTKVTSPKLRLNFEADVYALVVLPLLTAFGSMKTEETGVKLISTSKLVRQYGILDRVRVRQEGSEVTTHNLVWDAHTGAVLLSSTQNEFRDPVYSFSYPAHWHYDGMGFASHNADNVLVGNISFNGLFTPSPNQATNVYAQGDEVLVEYLGLVPGTPQYAWITSTTTTPSVAFALENRAGMTLPQGACKLRVVRSHRRNMPSTALGSITSLASPYNSTANRIEITGNTRVINASATEFSQNWQAYCCAGGVSAVAACATACDTRNPYTNGILGNWRTLQQRAFLSSRNQGTMSVPGTPNTAPSTDIRNLGTLENFSPFWSWSSGHLVPDDDNPLWQWTSRIEVIDPFGNALQDVDPLGRRSAMLYGYNHQAVVAEASNSELRQIGFDSFEDYSVNPPSGFLDYSWFIDHVCNLPEGFRFRKYNGLGGTNTDRVSITREESHTGLSSLKLECGTATYVFATANPQCTTETACSTCVPNILPNPGESYILSMWVKAPSGTPTPRAEIRYISSTTVTSPLSLTPDGPVIEGWQRVFARFQVPADESTGFKFVLIGPQSATAPPVYFDDLRLHPVAASMRTTVYNPWTLRVMAMLDENNYATLYEYDVQGDLIRVKRETERGVMTVQEGRNNLPRVNVFPIQ